jgi:hypothetical protein
MLERGRTALQSEFGKRRGAEPIASIRNVEQPFLKIEKMQNREHYERKFNH